MTTAIAAPIVDVEPQDVDPPRRLPAPCVAADVCPMNGQEFCPDDQKIIDRCTAC